MNPDQFSRYLEAVDHPRQLSLKPDEVSLHLLYREHITRFPYQNIDLYRRGPVVDLSVDSLLDYMTQYGGHCYQQSELLFSALTTVGFTVTRLASWVLMGSEFQAGAPHNHNILLVTIGERRHLLDPGLASASPRHPLCFNMRATEEIEPCKGDQYKLEVNGDHYNFYWKMKGVYFLLYRFERDIATGLPKTSDQSVTLAMCEAVYSVPVFIPIRDKYVKVSLQTQDSVLSFLYIDGVYNFKVIRHGQPVEEKNLSCAEFFQLIKELCHIDFEPSELNIK